MKKIDKVSFLTAAIVMTIGLFIIIATFVTLPGCATSEYLETMTAWNDMMESYEIQYQHADAATQAKWKAEIDPKIIEANNAINTWGAAVGAANEQEKRAAFITLEREAVQLLLKHAITIEN